MTRTELFVLAAANGLCIATRSTGDGETRYKFFHARKPFDSFDYHEGHGIYVCHRLREAQAWLRGYSEGATPR